MSQRLYDQAELPGDLRRSHEVSDALRLSLSQLYEEARARESDCGSMEWCDGDCDSLASPDGCACSSQSSDLSCDDIFGDDDLEPFNMINRSRLRHKFTETRHAIHSDSYERQKATDKKTADSFCCTTAAATSAIVAPNFFPAACPDDLLCEILSYLNVESLQNARLVSKHFKTLGSRDEAGWSEHCRRLWRNKVHVSWRATHMEHPHKSMSAYNVSCEEGANRQEITLPELCFDPISEQGTMWYFRFKEAAGMTWTSFDPWHAGLDARRMVFLTDGTVRELVADSNENTFRVEHPFFDAPNQQGGERDPISMNWRFILSPLDMPSRPRGAYIRLNVGGRDVPTYIVQRSPTGNWGFVIENCWGFFASFPLPRKQEDVTGRPHRPIRMRLRRTTTGGVRWLNVDGIESDSDEDDMEVDSVSTGDSNMLTDRALPTTNRRQWREALLYNYGSVSLPEGDAALAEFDRIFDSFRSPVESLDMAR